MFCQSHFPTTHNEYFFARYHVAFYSRDTIYCTRQLSPSLLPPGCVSRALLFRLTTECLGISHVIQAVVSRAGELRFLRLTTSLWVRRPQPGPRGAPNALESPCLTPARERPPHPPQTHRSLEILSCRRFIPHSSHTGPNPLYWEKL